MTPTLVQALALALPALAANMAPVIAARWNLFPTLERAIDGGHTWRGSALFGHHKTWRGFVIAIGVGGFVGFTLPYMGIANEVLGGAVSGVVYGMYAGFLAITGDLIKSGIKRRVGVSSGKPFLPWDQIDYMILFLIGTYGLFHWPLVTIGFLLGIAFFGNLITNYVAFKCGIKSTPW